MQPTLFELKPISKGIDTSEWGTFRDSLRAPIHGWFTYPAGFSHLAVEHSIREANLRIGKDTIYDPFMGSGTTNIVARSLGFNSIGVEAHPFVYEITKTKMEWNIKSTVVRVALDNIQSRIMEAKVPAFLTQYLQSIFPELILKCFLPVTLFELMIIRDAVNQIEDTRTRNFLRTALICTLRDVSIAATGWPYIAPNKVKVTSQSKNAWDTYRKRVMRMLGDIDLVNKQSSVLKTEHRILLGDSRETKQIESKSVNHIFTSPPYLNNFDYADRTRLEMYFMGDAANWGDITEQIRTKLMTSATTQISRTDLRYEFLTDFERDSKQSHSFLVNAVEKLSTLRLIKGGKKSYDLMVIGYFNDMYRIIKENFRVLTNGSKAVYILGDSAPYGIHIPTDELIGQIGVDIGFKKYSIKVLRERGGKWANNPQRHTVKLKESVVILQK